MLGGEGASIVSSILPSSQDWMSQRYLSEITFLLPQNQTMSDLT